MTQRSDDTRPPLVTVVTACLNSEETIGDTVESVLDQTYPHIEYIIIDGGSVDSTLDVIRRFGDRIHKVVSEPDEGISDAFNKGIALATGDYIQLLNADDRIGPTKIAESVRILEESPESGFAFGDLELLDRDGRTFLHVEGDSTYLRGLHRCMPRVNHPTFLVRRSVYGDFGAFDRRWHMSMDYDWLLRVSEGGVKGVYSPSIKASMRVGGVSERHPVRCMNEERRISIAHGRSSLWAGLDFVLRAGKLWARRILEVFLPQTVIARLRPGKSPVEGSGRSRHVDGGRA